MLIWPLLWLLAVVKAENGNIHSFVHHENIYLQRSFYRKIVPHLRPMRWTLLIKQRKPLMAIRTEIWQKVLATAVWMKIRRNGGWSYWIRCRLLQILSFTLEQIAAVWNFALIIILVNYSFSQHTERQRLNFLQAIPTKLYILKICETFTNCHIIWVPHLKEKRLRNLILNGLYYYTNLFSSSSCRIQIARTIVISKALEEEAINICEFEVYGRPFAKSNSMIC